MDNLFLIIIQEFYFSFFLTFYRINVVAKSKSFGIKTLFIFSAFVILLIIYFLEVASNGIILIMSALIFPLYMVFSSNLEKKSFSNAIKIENYSSLFSVLLLFSISFILNIFKIEWIGLIYIRFFTFFSVVIAYYIFNYDYKDPMIFNKTKFNFMSNDIISIPIILFLMFYKFTIIKNGVLTTDASSLETKIFIFLYDFIAAIYGFLLRFIVSRKNIKDSLKKETALTIVFTLFTLILCVSLYIARPYLTEILVYSLLSTFVLASSFGIFILNEINIISYYYIFIIITSTIINLLYGLKISSVSFLLFVLCLLPILIIKNRSHIETTT